MNQRCSARLSITLFRPSSSTKRGEVFSYRATLLARLSRVIQDFGTLSLNNPFHLKQAVTGSILLPQSDSPVPPPILVCTDISTLALYVLVSLVPPPHPPLLALMSDSPPTIPC